MLTTKKQKRALLASAALAVGLLGGCADRGPAYLLEGERLIGEGKYPAAVEKLTSAVERLPQNAQAWNHLGLAYHHNGDTQKAIDAYRRALQLDRNLAIARFNLGCLHLEKQQYADAANELTIYLGFEPKSVDALLKLGSAQLHEAMRVTTAADKTRWLDAAKKNFELANSLELSADAYNGLGMIEVQRNRPREARSAFEAALRKEPNHAGAALNLAILYHQYLNDRKTALQKYREFLATQPRSSRHKEIEEIARQLDLEFAPPPAVSTPPPTVVTPPATTAATTPKPKETKESKETPPPATTVAKTETPAPSTTTPKPPPSAATATTRVEPPTRGGELLIKPAETAPKPTPKPGVSPASSGPRYRYTSPPKPAAGNRVEAIGAFNEGAQAQKEGNVTKAVEAFQNAVKADPAFFEAHFKLAWIAYSAENYSSALRSYEQALAVSPDSGAARYNFALTLQKAGYPADAAAELEKVVSQNPSDARAHLSLGVLYDRELRRKDLARVHYSKVLELEPQHPQALDIRYWLKENEK